MSQIELPDLPADADVEATKAYVRQLVRTIGPGWHPEDPQDSYVNLDTGAPVLTNRQSTRLSSDVRCATRILAVAGIDICAVALPVQKALLRKMGVR